MKAIRLRAIFAMAGLCVLAACGGGGGAEGGPSSVTLPDAKVSVDTSPVLFQYVQGVEPTVSGSPEVVATLTRVIRVEGFDLANPPANFGIAYFVYGGKDDVPLDLKFSLINANTLNVSFFPRPGLPLGSYSGELYLAACFLDEAFENCIKEFSGSPSAPQRIEFTVLPPLTLGASTSSSNFASVGRSQEFSGSTQIDGLRSADDMEWSIEYSTSVRDWVSLVKTDTGLDHTVRTLKLPQGTHVATVTVRSKSTQQQVQFRLEVQVSQNLLSAGFGGGEFALLDSTQPEDVRFHAPISVSTIGGPLAWTATSDVPWIVFDKASGVSGEELVYRFLPSQLDLLPVNVPGDENPSIGTITVGGTEPQFGIAPIQHSIRLSRLTSKFEVVSGPIPVNSTGHALSIEGLNLLDGTRTYALSGPSPWSLSQGRIDLAPSVPGVYTISLPNALGLTPSSATASFVPQSAHTSGFVVLPGFKRTMQFDQRSDALYLVDKSSSQLTRLSHSNGSWSTSARPIPNISDLGLSSDRRRLFVTQTTGVVRRVDPLNLQDSAVFTWGNPFPESLRLSAGLAVLRSRGDVIPILTPSFFEGDWVLPGVVSYVDISGAFQPVTGYRYTPNNGGWFAGRGSGPVLFSQKSWGPFDESSAALVNPGRLDSSSAQISQGPFPPFEHLDQGLTSVPGLAGVFDRKTLINRIGFSSQIPSLPEGFRKVGLLVSSDWKFIFVLAYPEAALNNDAPTALLPTVFVYEIKEASQYIYTVEARNETLTLSAFPSCRRDNDTSCILDTLADTTLDGRTLFFGGDQGVAVVQVPSSLQPGVMSNRATSARALGGSTVSEGLNARARFGAGAKASFVSAPRR
jgi:hypothetical protein